MNSKLDRKAQSHTVLAELNSDEPQSSDQEKETDDHSVLSENNKDLRDKQSGSDDYESD